MLDYVVKIDFNPKETISALFRNSWNVSYSLYKEKEKKAALFSFELWLCYDVESQC